MEYINKDHLLTVNYGTTEDYKERSTAWDKYQNSKISVVDKALENLDFTRDKLVLDAGCGLGRFSLKAAEKSTKNSRIIAFDISEEMVKHVSIEATKLNLSNVQTVLGSLDSLPFDENYFDEIYCNLVLYHIEDINRALSELYRVLKPSGKILFLVPEYRWLKEIIEWQDRALLRIGYSHNHRFLEATGTDRFCRDNASNFIEKYFGIEKSISHNGSMTFPSSTDLIEYYSHSMRFKNVISDIDGPSIDVLKKHVESLVKEDYPKGKNIPLSSFCEILYCFKRVF